MGTHLLPPLRRLPPSWPRLWPLPPSLLPPLPPRPSWSVRPLRAAPREPSIDLEPTLIQIRLLVGGGTLVYTPSTLVVPVGGKIVFQFKILNHSVTQSQSFAMPCASLPGGIDSGFMPVANNSVVPLPSYTVTINDTMPVYFHCKQNNHCAGVSPNSSSDENNGTVPLAGLWSTADAIVCIAGNGFIANPSTADPIDQFILNAKASAASASPSYFSPSLMNTLT
jgi:hypothetical protein